MMAPSHLQVQQMADIREEVQNLLLVQLVVYVKAIQTLNVSAELLLLFSLFLSVSER